MEVGGTEVGVVSGGLVGSGGDVGPPHSSASAAHPGRLEVVYPSGWQAPAPAQLFGLRQQPPLQCQVAGPLLPDREQ